MKKLLLIALLIVGYMFGETIVMETVKERPASLYLGKLAQDKEKQHYKWKKYWSSFFIFYGVALANSSGAEDYYGKELGALIGIGGLTGLIINRPNDFFRRPKTDAGKKFKIIKDIQDIEQKEKIAYESLVSLAESSRIKQDDKFGDNPFYLMINKDWLTAEEQALDDFLKQIPIK
jgi:hypothetical protein